MVAALWLLGVVGCAAGLLLARRLGAVTVVPQSLAAGLVLLLAIGLAVRGGGRVLPAAVVAALVGGAAVLTQWSVLLAGASVATGVLAACLAVLGTRPAGTLARVVLEVALAQTLATVGALGISGLAADLDPDRFTYTVLGLSMLATVALVYRLGGGLHGLGRRGVLLVGGGLVVLALALVYTAALSRWGSPELRLEVAQAQQWGRDHLGAVPHPIEVLVGVPALAWGVSMRARRRQGWWVCAFGAAATANATTRLLEESGTALETALGATYSVVLGLLLGYLVVRPVRLVRSSPAARARVRPTVTPRVEPPRLRPLH